MVSQMKERGLSSHVQFALRKRCILIEYAYAHAQSLQWSAEAQQKFFTSGNNRNSSQIGHEPWHSPGTAKSH